MAKANEETSVPLLREARIFTLRIYLIKQLTRNNFIMREAPLKWLGLFYYIAAYLLAIIGLLNYFSLVTCILYSSLIFIGLAFAVSIVSKTRAIPYSATSYFKIWLGQATSYLLIIAGSALWLARFPNYGATQLALIHQLGYNLILASTLLSCLLIMFTTLMRRLRQPVSILLFFPNSHAAERLAIYGNIWFRKATMLVSLLLLFLAGSVLTTSLKLNNIASIISIVTLSLVIKLPFFYRWLQVANKRLRLGFASILMLLILTMLILSLILGWFLKPFTITAAVNLNYLGSHAPLLIFWGLAICCAIPLAYLLAPIAINLSARQILLVCLGNPLLWLINLLDYHFSLLFYLQHLPKPVIMSIAIIMLVLSYFWLNSDKLAKLNAIFFGNQGHKHQGPMPRIMVKNNLPIAFMIMFSLLVNAAFWLQVELLATTACVLISCLIACFIFFRIK